MVPYKSLGFFRRKFYKFNSRINSILDTIRFFKLNQMDCIQDPNGSRSYNKDLSFLFKWLNLSKQSAITDWQSVTDEINGGSSKAQFCFNKNQSCINYQGYVETKDKDRMISYPFINIMKQFNSRIVAGPLKLLQIQAKTDGKPVQVYINIKSMIKGQANIYGFIMSKQKEWNTYQIPIQNMILRGTQQDYHNGPFQTKDNFFSSKNSTNIFDHQFESTKKVLNTEIQNERSLTILNIGFRLVSTVDQQRSIDIRSVNLAAKKGFDHFVTNYKNPYFYITKNQIDKDNSLNTQDFQIINNSLDNIHEVDTGDIKYKSKPPLSKKRTNK